MALVLVLVLALGLAQAQAQDSVPARVRVLEQAAPDPVFRHALRFTRIETEDERNDQ